MSCMGCSDEDLGKVFGAMTQGSQGVLCGCAFTIHSKCAFVPEASDSGGRLPPSLLCLSVRDQEDQEQV